MKKAFLAGLSCFVALSVSLPVQAACAETCSIGGCNLGECFMDVDGDGYCGDHCFVDENGDGICDNHCYIDDNCDGVCDLYFDDDEDGICDHCHEHGKPVQTNNYQNQTTRRSRRHGGCHSSGHHNRHC